MPETDTIEQCQQESTLNDLLSSLEKEIYSLKRDHYVCDSDCWYSCPLSNECCDDSRELKCDCGADKQNLIVLASINLINKIRDIGR